MFSAPKGVPDYFPPTSAAFAHVRSTLTRAAELAGYGYIELPVFEDTALFSRGVGESTDVVTKEMYTFLDRGDRSITLRPEGTAGVMRAVIEHSLDRGSLPVKLYYAGQFFRAEAPQAGRYRQFHQVGIEAIGVDDPALDAEVIAVGDAGFRALGLTGYRLELTSLGDANCRPAYRSLLQEFLSGLPLDEATLLSLRATTHNTAVPTIVHGGHRINVIPSEISVDIDGRILPGQDAADWARQVQAAVGDEVEVTLTRGGEGLEADPASPFYDAIAASMGDLDSGARVMPFLVSGGTDAQGLPGI